MPEKLDRCVDDIKAKGDADGVNPWAVCNASISESSHFDKLVEALKKESRNPQERLDRMNPQPTKHSNPHKTLDPEPSNIGHTDPRKTLDPEPKHDGHRNPREPLDPKMSEIDMIEREAVSIGGGLSAQSVGGKRHEDQEKLTIANSGHRSIYSDYEKKKNKVEECLPCKRFDKLHETLIQEAEDDTEWITVKGAHIPIKKGESKDEVVKAFLAGKGEKGEKKTGSGVSAQSDKELVSSIKAGSKNWKDWGRNESNEKEYAEIEKRNQAVPKPKRPEGAGGTIFQDDPNAIPKLEKKIKYLEDQQDYWKKITKFPARDYHTRPHQLGDAKWYEASSVSTNLRETKKKLAKIQERKEAGTTLERKVTYKGGKPRFYYKENPKEGTSETIDSNSIFDNVLNALRKETS